MAGIPQTFEWCINTNRRYGRYLPGHKNIEKTYDGGLQPIDK